MAYQPFEIQVLAHQAFLLDNYKRGVLYWSRRTGKTLWSIQQLMLSAMLNQGQHHIVFREYQQAETVAWNQYLHTIPNALIEGQPNKSTLTVNFKYMGDDKTGQPAKITFPNGKVLEVMHDRSKPSSSIRLLGSDKALSHLGGESMGMIFDEYQDQQTWPWDQVYKFFLATTGGWACFMGTARSDDEWNEMLERAEKNYEGYTKGYLADSDAKDAEINKRWYYSKATWRSNPKIKPSWIAAERKQAEEQNRLGMFLQETELIPFTVQGAVYPMFDQKIHHIDAEDIPKEGTDYIALDFGFAEGHPMAACFIRITRDDVWYQWDEIHGTGIQLDDAIAEIKMKMGDRQITGIIADSARPDLIDYMASKGLPVIPSPKTQNSVSSGIQLLAKRLRPKIQIVGDPKPNYFIDTKNCPKTKYDFTHYRYKEVKEDRHPLENPEKKFDDSMDSLRYMELFFKFGHKKDEKVPQASVVQELNQFGLL